MEKEFTVQEAFEAMLQGKIVNFKKGYKKEYQDNCYNKIGNDFTIDAIECNGNLKLFSLKSTDCIYDVPVQQVIITNNFN